MRLSNFIPLKLNSKVFPTLLFVSAKNTINISRVTRKHGYQEARSGKKSILNNKLDIQVGSRDK